VIVLLAGIGGGFYVGTYRRLQAEKATRDFLYMAKLARITAIERQSPCEIELDADKNRYSLSVYGFNQEKEQSGKIPLRGPYAKPVQLNGDIKFEDIKITQIGSEEVVAAGEEKRIVFSPNGTAQEAVIQIGDGRNHYTVSICAATARASIIFGTAEEVETTTVDLDEEL